MLRSTGLLKVQRLSAGSAGWKLSFSWPLERQLSFQLQYKRNCSLPWSSPKTCPQAQRNTARPKRS